MATRKESPRVSASSCGCEDEEPAHANYRQRLPQITKAIAASL